MEEKKAHGIQLLIRAIVRDPDGKIITDTGRKPSKSYVIQFLEFIYFLALAATSKCTSINGTEQFIYGQVNRVNQNFNIKAAANQDLYGIVVGTGDTAETNTDYKLETMLTQGVGAGNITHGEMVVGTTAVVGANVDLELTRAFTNLTGAAITVKEAGAYVNLAEQAALVHCIMRDVLGDGGVEIPDKCSLTIIYALRTTV